MLAGLYTPSMLDDSYRYCDCVEYFAPVPSTSLAGHVAFVRGLPFDDAPTLFGLHENASLAAAIADSGAMCASALQALPQLVGPAAVRVAAPRVDVSAVSPVGSPAMLSLTPSPVHTPAPKGSSDAGGISDLAALAASLLAQIPAPFHLDAIADRHPAGYHACMNVMLAQEAMRYNRLIDELRSSLSELRDAVLV